MQQRIYGVETEYALSFETQDRRLRSQDVGALFNHLERALLERYRALKSDSFGRNPTAQNDGINIREGYFLESGARFYYDTGHVEWATPEATTAQQAVLYELAGERTLAEVAQMIPAPHGGRLLLVKNNIDFHGATYGCHENYLVQRRATQREDQVFFDRLVEQLVPFLVTRQIFCGAGRVGAADPRAARDVGYQISQRADFIQYIRSQDTRSDRAIVNQKDEALGDTRRYRRLHLIVGDSNMSPYAAILKLGTTGIVLRLIEEEALHDVPVLDDPVEAVKAISHDLTCRGALLLADGEPSDPIKIQRYYLDAARSFFEHHPPSDATRQVVDMWQATLDDLMIDPLRLADRVDWVIKWRYLMEPQLSKVGTDWRQIAAWNDLIQRLAHEGSGKNGLSAEQYARHQHYLSQHGLSWNDYADQRRLHYALRELDLRYHDIDPGRSLYYTLQRAGKIRQLFNAFDNALIRDAQVRPPHDTRAQLRAQVIGAAHERGEKDTTTLDWGQIGLSHPHSTVSLDDPFSLTHPDIDRYLRGGAGRAARKRTKRTPDADDAESDILVLSEEMIDEADGGLRNWFKRLLRR